VNDKSNLQVKEVEFYETKPGKAITAYGQKLKGHELIEVRDSLTEKGFRQINLNLPTDELGFSNGVVIFLLTLREGTVTGVSWRIRD
jgi:hypothetical protein